MQAKALAETQQDFTRVLREKLLNTIKANRSVHVAEVEEALAGWRGEYTRAATRWADEVRAAVDTYLESTGGECETVYPEFPDRPEDHTADYDREIRRLEMCMDEEIYLSRTDFNRYVLDDWGWKAMHTASVANYAANGRRR